MKTREIVALLEHGKKPLVRLLGNLWDDSWGDKGPAASKGCIAPPVSAGMIRVREKRWAITEGGSSTLKLGRMGSDEKYIGMVLSKFGFTYDIEVSY